MPGTKKAGLQPARKDWTIFLSAQHFKYRFNMLLGAGQKVIIQHNISFGDRQFPKPSGLPAGGRNKTSSGCDNPLK